MDQQIRDLVFPFWQQDFEQWKAKYGSGFLFHRYTLLWLLRHAVVTCNPDGLRLDEPRRFETLGEALLIANDLAAFISPKPLRTDLEIAANMLPNTEYFSQEDFNREVARCIYLFTDVAPNADGTSFPAFAARIQELLDYQVHTYCDLALARAMKILATDTSRPHEYQIPLLGAQDFSTTGIPVNIAASFLDSIASDEQTLARTINEGGRYDADLSAFREKPLSANNGRYLTLDTAFVLDKAGRSLFWTALKNAPQGERNQLLVEWGKLLERYLNLLLSENLGPQSTLVPNPSFEDGAEACDAAIQEGRTLIMMEYKASTISNAIKYADDPTQLQKVLEERFIVGTEQGRKGLAQLWEAIRRFTQGDALVCPVSNTTISAESVHTIVPVLVHLDNALRTPGLPNYVKTRFKEFGRVKTHTMLPLTLLPISELEQMEGHMPDYKVGEMIESFQSVLRQDRTSYS